MNLLIGKTVKALAAEIKGEVRNRETRKNEDQIKKTRAATDVVSQENYQYIYDDTFDLPLHRLGSYWPAIGRS